VRQNTSPLRSLKWESSVLLQIWHAKHARWYLTLLGPSRASAKYTVLWHRGHLSPPPNRETAAAGAGGAYVAGAGAGAAAGGVAGANCPGAGAAGAYGEASSGGVAGNERCPCASPYGPPLAGGAAAGGAAAGGAESTPRLPKELTRSLADAPAEGSGAGGVYCASGALKP